MSSKKKRNKCPCGSGLKKNKCSRKKTCNGTKRPPLAAIHAAERFKNPPRELTDENGFLLGRPFVDTEFQGKRVRAVGGSIYKRPLGETFHQFILDHFGHAIGFDWIAEERAKPEKERHPLSIWGAELVDRINNESFSSGKAKAIKQTGNIKSLLVMAYDYYLVCHCNAKIQPKFIKKLKNKDGFQGARYELAVAGIAIRAGFDITWLNSKQKHCEFKGVHKTMPNTEVLFECKSHGRSGILGKSGEYDPEKTGVKVLSHISEAIEQSDKNTPLIIFDDINLPLTPDLEFEEKNWPQEAETTFKKFGFHTKYKTSNYGALFMTNFSWYLHEDISSMKKGEVISYFHTGGRFSIAPEAISLLKIASEQYGYVPARLEDLS